MESDYTLTSMDGERRTRADERRGDVLNAAIAEFAAKGLHGASTERIAAAAGISHPYLFKLFGSKRDLFLAASKQVYGHIHATFRDAAAAHPAVEGRLWAMGKAYMDLLARRDELRVLLHSFAAAGDPEIGPTVRRWYVDLYRYVRDVSGASDAEMKAFWGHGMLLTIAAAIDLPQLAGEEEWIQQLLQPPA